MSQCIAHMWDHENRRCMNCGMPYRDFIAGHQTAVANPDGTTKSIHDGFPPTEENRVNEPPFPVFTGKFDANGKLIEVTSNDQSVILGIGFQSQSSTAEAPALTESRIREIVREELAGQRQKELDALKSFNYPSATPEQKEAYTEMLKRWVLGKSTEFPIAQNIVKGEDLSLYTCKGGLTIDLNDVPLPPVEFTIDADEIKKQFVESNILTCDHCKENAHTLWPVNLLTTGETLKLCAACSKKTAEELRPDPIANFFTHPAGE